MKKRRSLLVVLPALFAMTLAGCGGDKGGDTGGGNEGGQQTETVSVTGVTLNETTKTLQVDETFTLTATVAPESASNKNVTWESSDTDVATVEDGVVTAISVGTATIKVKTVDGNKEATCAVTVTAKPFTTTHTGTFEDPYSGADAVLVANSLAKGNATTESFYIKGTVESFEETFTASYGNYSFKIDGGFICWRLKNGSGQAKFNEGDIEVGDEVLVYAQIQRYTDGKPETKGGYVVSVKKPGAATATEILAVTAAPTEVEKDGQIDPGTVTLSVKFSDESTKTVSAQQVVCDTTTLGETTATAKYEGLEKTFSVTVVQPYEVTHAGTQADPYTGADAVIVANKLEKGESTSESFYIKGTVESFEETFTASYGNYSFKIDGGFICWRLKNGSGQAKFNEGDIEVGDEVLVYAQIQRYTDGKPETKGGYVVSVTKPTVNVTGVTLDKTTLTLEAGGLAGELVATVAPDNATDPTVTWSSDNTEVATVNNGVVTPVAEGSAIVTVTTVNGEFTATCEVTVTAATRTMTGITVEGPTKIEYTEGETLDLTGLVVKATYDSGDPEEISTGYTTSIENGTALTLADTSLVVTYGEFTQTIALTVNEKGPIVSEGTYTIKHTRDNTTYYMCTDVGSSNQPLVTTDASKAAVFDIALKAGTKDTYTLKLHGEEKYLAIGADSNNGIRFQTASFEWIITEGSKSTGSYDFAGVYGTKTRYLTMYDNTDFRCYDSATATNRKENTDLEAVVVKTVDSIEVKQDPTKMTYYVGEAFDPTGLIITVHYTDGSSEDITEGFTFEGSTGFQAANEDRTVKITYQSKNAYVQHVAVVEDDRTINSIKIDDESVLKKTSYKEGDSWDATGVKVIGVRSDLSEVELTSGVTFSFDSEKAAVGVTSLEITAKYNNGTSDLTASKTFTVSVTAVTADTPTEIVLSTDGGTNASGATVKYNGVDFEKAVKCGTGKAAGAMKIKVPAGATKLVFFAAAWNGETVTLKVTGLATEKTVALTNDTGVSGNSPFTLAGTDDANFKKEIVFDAALTAETELTLTATGGNRFVVWNAGYLK